MKNSGRYVVVAYWADNTVTQSKPLLGINRALTRSHDLRKLASVRTVEIVTDQEAACRFAATDSLTESML